MRLIEYINGQKEPRLGLMLNDLVYDAAVLVPDAPNRMLDLIRAGRPAWELLRENLRAAKSARPVGPIDQTCLCAPLPNPPKLLCVAANYGAHIAESGFQSPVTAGVCIPQFFSKFPSTTIIGPNDRILIGAYNVALDWELELAVIIGQRGRNIPEERALDYVFGYTVANDISERKLNSKISNRQSRPNDGFFDWLVGKWFDGACPLGPAITTTDEIEDPQKLSMKLWLNDELVQDSSTAYMLSSVGQLISYISRILTLEPGDVIATGTPEGTGLARGRFLQPGDRLRSWIELIGYVENPVVSDTPS